MSSRIGTTTLLDTSYNRAIRRPDLAQTLNCEMWSESTKTGDIARQTFGESSIVKLRTHRNRRRLFKGQLPSDGCSLILLHLSVLFDITTCVPPKNFSTRLEWTGGPTGLQHITSVITCKPDRRMAGPGPLQHWCMGELGSQHHRLNRKGLPIWPDWECAPTWIPVYGLPDPRSPADLFLG